VTIGEMVRALIWAVEHPSQPGERRVLEVPQIRRPMP
jgi:hypothetical protein